MGRARVPAAQGRDRPRGARKRRRAPGLTVEERDGHWHIVGTLRVDGRSLRIRKSTELPARPDLEQQAWDLIDGIEKKARERAIYGVTSVPLGVAASAYLELMRDGTPKPGGRGDLMGPSDRRVLAEIIAIYGLRDLDKIEEQEWNEHLDRRHDGNSADTRARYCNPLVSFLEWCSDKQRGYIRAMPVIKRRGDGAKAASPTAKRAARRQVADLRPDLLVFLFDQAAIHLKAQLYAEWSTGARVSSVLFGCTLGDLVLGTDRQRLTYRLTKNGDDVHADLHPASVAVLRDYLVWRGRLHERNEPLFLTDERRPYSDRGRRMGWGGANKTAFNAMKRRAILLLLRESVRARRAGDTARADALRADAKLVRKVTQHWLRHWFATHSMAAEMPNRLIMAQAGWRDERSLLRYQHDVPEVRRRLIEQLPIGGTSLTRKAGDGN